MKVSNTPARKSSPAAVSSASYSNRYSSLDIKLIARMPAKNVTEPHMPARPLHLIKDALFTKGLLSLAGCVEATWGFRRASSAPRAMSPISTSEIGCCSSSAINSSSYLSRQWAG